MIFVSLAEIFGESTHQFKLALATHEQEGLEKFDKTTEGNAMLFSTLCFVGGILLIYAIEAIIKRIAPEHELTEVENLANLGHIATWAEENEPPSDLEDGSVKSAKSPIAVAFEFQVSPIPEAEKAEDEKRKAQLKRMGILTAVALGLHNLPEGIATFAGGMQGTRVGLALAVGIGLHNIPEGIAVAAPIYFATGSKLRGLMWCTISALAEPFGGCLAWVAFRNGMSASAYGVLYGLVSGIMVCITVKELIPTAHAVAPKHPEVISISVFGGMCVMVLSLVLFAYAGE